MSDYYTVLGSTGSLNAGINFTPTEYNDSYSYISPSNAPQVYQGRTIVITGASRGIGASIARSFAASGATNIAILARNSAALETLAGELKASSPSLNVLPLALDVTSPEGVSSTLEAVVKRFGAIDVLVNNAAVYEPMINVVHTDPEVWWRTFDVNIRGVYLMTRAALPSFRDGKGTIINVTSTGAHRLFQGISAYETSKFALLRFSELMQLENPDLVVLAVHPGHVPTEMGLQNPKEMHKYLVDTPELAADTIAWLAREERLWLGGRYVSVNWDMEHLNSMKEKMKNSIVLKMRMVVEFVDENGVELKL